MVAESLCRDTYTWMFYDTTEAIELNKNYIAQSAHFHVQGSSTSSTSSISSTSSTSTSTSATGSGTVTPLPSKHSKNSLSSAAAAGIGVAATLLFVVLCLLGGFCLFRRRSRRDDRTNEILPFGKPELEDRAGLTVPSLPGPEENHELRTSQRTNVARPRSVDNTSSSPYHEVAASSLARAAQPPFYRSESDVLPATAYEMYSDSRVANPRELSGTSALSTIHRKELPGDNRGRLDPMSNQQQDGATTSPQSPHTPNTGSYVEYRKPLPTSHDTHSHWEGS